MATLRSQLFANFVGIEVALKEFITKAPEFCGDTEIVGRLGQLTTEQSHLLTQVPSDLPSDG